MFWGVVSKPVFVEFIVVDKREHKTSFMIRDGYLLEQLHLSLSLMNLMSRSLMSQSLMIQSLMSRMSRNRMSLILNLNWKQSHLKRQDH